MAQEVLMPKLGLTMTEGTIEEWKYKEGDSVKKGDILFSVATDKLTNDVEAEADGVLLKILLPEGETAPCKAVIAYIGEAGEVIAEGGASAESTAAQAPDAKRQTSRDPQERSESDRASVRPSFRTRPREQSHTNHTDRFRPFSGTVRPLCLRAVPS